MTKTPWGSADELHERRLSPGPGLSRKEVERNQRARLHAAMVAVVSEKGYAFTQVSDVVERAGVSRGTFYEYFADREDCFLSTFRAIQEGLGTAVAAATAGGGTWDERLRRGLDAIVALTIEQPAAARFCMLEIYAVGPRGLEHADRAIDDFTRLAARGISESPERADMPTLMITALIGGVGKVIQTRLRKGTEHELPELIDGLWHWALCYRPPPARLRTVRASRTAEGGLRHVAETKVDRMFDAVATVTQERGYLAMTVTDIARTASVSLSTFYANFRTKEEAFLAAYDAGHLRAATAGLVAYQSARDWQRGIRQAFEATFAMLAAEPGWAYMAAVGVLSAGARGHARRDRAIATLSPMVEPGYDLVPMLAPIATEAIGGAVYRLMYDQIRVCGAERLPEIVPLATFIVLTPFVEPDQAFAVANEARA